MSELRKDPIVSRWVIISKERGKRPSDYPPDEVPHRGSYCPFCEGNEKSTPPELLAFGRPEPAVPNGPGWKLRVVSNKYPALQIEGQLNPRGEGLFDIMDGIGAHEVIIETPAHHKDLTDLNTDEFRLMLEAYRLRLLDLRNDKRFRYILIFKNQGFAAGATVAHTHSQLIATPVVPRLVTEELEGTEHHFQFKERCVYCDIIRQEINDRKRVVAENEHFIAFEPFAARVPFETWIMPKYHRSHYEDEDTEHFRLLADLFRETLLRLKLALDNPPYNYMLHTAPVNLSKDWSIYHWHFEIVPKLTKVAGFEWGSGFYINPTPPEEAAAYLREVKIKGA